MADIESGIDERKHLHVFAVRFANGLAGRFPWLLSFGSLIWWLCCAARGLFDVCACALAGSSADADGRVKLGVLWPINRCGAGGAPVALHGWHPLAARFQRPCPSDSGVERRNPLGTVAICGLQRHFREGGRAHMLWEALGPHLSCEREEIVAICD